MPALADKRGGTQGTLFLLTPQTVLQKKKKKILLHKVLQYSFVYSNACMRAIRFGVTSNSCDLHSSNLLSTDTRRKQARQSVLSLLSRGTKKKPSSDEQMSHFVPVTFPLWFKITFFKIKFLFFLLVRRCTYLENALCTCTVR